MKRKTTNNEARNSVMRSGVSLLELLLVLTIITTLIAIAVITLKPEDNLPVAERVQLEANAEAIFNAIQAYKIDHRGWQPEILEDVETAGYHNICKQGKDDGTCVVLDELVTGGYIAKIPFDEDNDNTELTGFKYYYDPENSRTTKVLTYEQYVAAAGIDLETGLLAYWQMDETTGTTANDSSGNSKHGTLTNGPTWVDGKFNNGINFDGSNDYVDAGTFGALSTFTISGWFKQNAAGNQKWIGFSETNDTKPSWIGSGNNGVNSAWDCGVNSVSVDTINTTGTNWNHYTLTYDGNVAKCYLNGVLSGTSTSTVFNYSNTKVHIGKRAWAATGHFNGIIDELRIYNRALSPDDIQALHAFEPEILPEPTPDITTNLVAHWEMDESSGTSASDSSGNSHTGTLTNGPTWVAGKFGNGVNLDGTNDFVQVPDNNALEGMSALTVGMWIKPTQCQGPISSSSILFRKTNVYSFSLKPDCTLSLYVHNGTSWSSEIVSSGSVSTGVWTHVSVVYTGSTYVFYINGVASGAGTPSVVGTLNSNSENVGIGTWVNELSYVYRGQVDEVRVYNRALSAMDIAAVYEYEPEETPSDIVSGIVAHWKLNELSGTSAADSAGSNTGTYTNGAVLGLNGKYENGVFFDGSNDYITKTSSITGLPTGQSARTLSAWIKPLNTNPGGALIHYGDGASSGQEFILQFTTISGTTYLFTDGINGNNNVTISGAEIPVNGQWSHIAWVFDGSTGWQYYLNGALTKSGTYGTTINTATPTILNIADRTDVAQTNFPGSVDDVKIYNRALSGTDITALYNYSAPADISTGLVAHWKMDETSWGTVADSSGNSNNGTATGSPTVSGGKFANGGTFNGSSQYISAGNGSSINFGSGNFSACSWVKKSANGTFDVIMGKQDAAGNYRGWFLRFNTDNTLTFGTNYDSSWNSNGFITTSATYTDTNWHHVCGVFNGSGGNIKAYVDGTEAATGAATATYNINSSVNLRIAAKENGEHFAGSLDEARIYNRALSAVEVAALYMYAPGPVAHWKLDETSGTSASDSSGNNLSGTLTNGPTWVVGNYANAINMDGSDDFASVTASSKINFSEGNPFTISAWVNRSSTGTTHIIINKQQNTTNEYGYTLAISSTNKAEFGVLKQNAASATATSTTNILSGTWYFVTGVYDGSNVLVYVNGNLEASIAESFSASTQSLSNLYIGQLYNNTLRFNGKIDSVRIYNYVRTPSQIVEDMNSSN